MLSFSQQGEKGASSEEKILEYSEVNPEINPYPAKTETETLPKRVETPKKERKIFFDTKSMAEVYASQGYISIALEIYKRILQKNPSDTEAQKRISELETKLSSKRERQVRPHPDSD
jgi:hypothetical protein